MFLRALPAIIIVLLILWALTGGIIVWNNHAERQSQERIVNAFGDTYRGLAKECYNRESVNCCLSSVSSMQAKKATLISERWCPSGTAPNMLRCESTYTWCESPQTF